MRRYRTALSDSFDVYLTLMRRVAQQVAKKLGRDGINWRVQNACSACCYEVRHLPVLCFNHATPIIFVSAK